MLAKATGANVWVVAVRIIQAEMKVLRSDFRRLIADRSLEAGATKSTEDITKANFLVWVVAVQLRQAILLELLSW